MRVVVTEIDEWDVIGEVDPGLPTFEVSGIAISPTLTCHSDVVVTGLDWLPIQGDKVALLVHTPHLYFGKPHLEKQGVRRDLRKLPDGQIEASLGKIREVAGSSLLIGGSSNHYHWLVDYLPRLLVALRCLNPLPRVLVHRLTPMQAESLNLLGIEQWEGVADDEAVRCERLWIPSLLARNTVVHPAVPKLLRKSFPPKSSSPFRDVYLSRNDAATRRIVNESELLSAIPEFAVRTAGAMTFQEQIDLFAGCERLVAPHGAGLTNMVFCRPGTRIFEFFTPLHRATFFELLSRLTGCRHQFLPAHNVSFGVANHPMYGDWAADVAAARAALAAGRA